jgi:hypothetical protein
VLFRRFLLEHAAPSLEREYGGFVPQKKTSRIAAQEVPSHGADEG